MSEKVVAVKASARPKITRQASFGVGSGFDASGVTKAVAIDEELAIGHSYWVPDRSKVWKQVVIVALLNDEKGERAVCNPIEDTSTTLEFPVSVMTPPAPANPTVVDDITSLHFIHEAGILHNLQQRSKMQPPKPYTYMCNVMVAVNPLRRDLKFLNSMDYHKASPAEVVSLPPHPFGLAETVLRQLKQPKPLGMDQAVVISGESGAGKTESFKIVLNHLLTGTATTSSDLGEIALLEQRLHESNPMMEAIGNARTTRNHNSSRFGKFLKLIYENRTVEVATPKGERPKSMPQDYVLVGAEIETYLLEKTRIVAQNVGEGNFHVLYALLASCVDKHSSSALTQSCRLQDDPGKHRYLLGADKYLKDPKSFEVPPLELFKLTTAGLLKVGMSSDKVDSIWQLLGAIIHLGDVVFENDDASFEDGTRVAGSDAKRSLHASASLLGLTPAALLNLLTNRTIETGKKKGAALIKPLNTVQASAARDNVAKLMYAIVFDWVIKQTNSVLRVGEQGGCETRSLGLLDLFGFESFAKNDMEQLLINLANEALQDMYCKQVLIAEMLLYKSEGLRVEEITFVSNSACVDLLVKGLVPLLDEQSQLATGTDKRFLANLYKSHKQNPYLLLPHAKVRQECFCIRHYAEDVLYTIGSFTQKNDNTIPKDLTNTLMKSSVELLVSIMKEVSDANALQEKMKKKAVTVAGDFAKSMSALTNELGRSQCSYIRCVKPNAMMKPGVFDQQYVVTQLRCLGLLQTCEVLKVGLPTRVPYAQLRDQFESHMPKGVRDMYKHRGDKEFTMAALDVFEVSRDHYHLGYTRLFFRPGRFTELDRVLKSCRSVPANDLADLMKRRLMRRLWRLMLCRVRVGLMWIGMLRKMREKRAKAMMLLKKNLRRKKVVRDWAALIMAEGERQEKEIRENKAATAITMCFFNWCCRKSRMFKVRHPNGPRKKVDAIADEQREIEMTEQQIKEHHENFKLQAARLREIGGEAEMRRFREQEVARITPTDMDRRIQALQGALKAFTNQDNDDTTSVQDNVSETGSTTKLPITDNTRFRSYKRPVYNRQVEHSAAFTPSLLAQNRIDSAMESSIQALTAMTKQLVIMNPIDKLVKLNHELHVANKRRPFSSKSSFRIKDAAMVLETMAREDAQVKACGMLLFDAEVVLHNLFELQRWHRTRSEVNENRQYNFKSPSTFAHHNLKVENVIGPYGNPGHRFHFQRKALNY